MLNGELNLSELRIVSVFQNNLFYSFYKATPIIARPLHSEMLFIVKYLPKQIQICMTDAVSLWNMKLRIREISHWPCPVPPSAEDSLAC